MMNIAWPIAVGLAAVFGAAAFVGAQRSHDVRDAKLAALQARIQTLETSNAFLRHECRGPTPWEGKR